MHIVEQNHTDCF